MQYTHIVERSECLEFCISKKWVWSKKKGLWKMCVCAATRLAKIYEGDCPTDGHAPISLHCYFVKEKKKYFKKIKLNFEN